MIGRALYNRPGGMFPLMTSLLTLSGTTPSGLLRGVDVAAKLAEIEKRHPLVWGTSSALWNASTGSLSVICRPEAEMRQASLALRSSSLGLSCPASPHNLS